MPRILETSDIDQYLLRIQAGGAFEAISVYAELKGLGYEYAGWARGVASGSSITGVAALEFLQGTARLGIGNTICQGLTEQQINNIRISMAEGYLHMLRIIAENNGHRVDRDVNFRETEMFHGIAFRANGLDLANWTLKIPMDLIRDLHGDEAVEQIWISLRDTGGDSVMAAAESTGLLAFVLQTSELDGFGVPARKVAADQWLTMTGGSTQAEFISNLWQQFVTWAYNKPWDAYDRRQNEIAALAIGEFFGSPSAMKLYEEAGRHSKTAQMNMIKGLIKLLYGPELNIAPLPGNRASTTLYAIDSDVTRGELLANARTDIGWRYALRELNSFVIADVDYVRHNTDGSLDLADAANGDGMTDQYIEDRSQMLAWKLRWDKYGAQDENDPTLYRWQYKPYTEEWDTSAVDGNWDYVDYTHTNIETGTPLTLAIDGQGLSFHDHQIVFGSRNIEVFAGEGDSDHLYGMGGNDSLSGRGENDHLEGGSGNDTLNGDEGSDTLLGGADNDLLDGGSSNDSLLGGDGTDVYRFGTGWGRDVIKDSDGGGSIEVAGLGTLSADGVRRIGEQVWVSADRNIMYRLRTDPAGNDLIITFSDRADTITVRNWSPGHLGLSLPTPTPPQDPGNVLTGDFRKQTNPDGTRYLLGADGNYVRDGDMPGAADQITGTSYADTVLGLGGDDALLGRGGTDYIDAGSGNDVVMGGTGADTIFGGSGNDLIYGSSQGSLLYPTHTDFEPAAATRPVVLARGFTWVLESMGLDQDGFYPSYLPLHVDRDKQPNDGGNTIDGGEGSDTILAGTGDDIVHGGTGRDELIGMAGDDLLLGEDGGDRIEGDGWDTDDPEHDVANAESSEHGIDVIDGGAGNDLLMGQGNGDFLFGGDDNDTMFGDDRNNVDTATEYTGDDFLSGGHGNDQMHGGGRADDLYGGEGDDSLWGDAGAVTVQSRAYLDPSYQGNDFLDGGIGNDYLQGEGGQDRLYGGSGNDSLVGDDAVSRLVGDWHRNDYLDGGEGNDELRGDGREDTLIGGTGDDYLDGDTVESELAGEFHGDDLLNGGDGADSLYGRGGDDVLLGGSGGDELVGDSKESYVSGQYHGNDYLSGEDGNDSLFGDGGNDTLIGGDGADYLGGDSAAPDVAGQHHGSDLLDGGAGNDTLFGSGDNDGLDGGLGNDALMGDDTVLGQEFHGSDTLDGGQGDDSLWGHGGNDVLSGGEGNDWVAGDDDSYTLGVGAFTGDDSLFGDAGNDTLVGGNGNDWLDGGAGDDLLAGGGGRDRYLLDFDSGQDVIVDPDTDSVFEFLSGSPETLTLRQVWSGGTPGQGDEFLQFSNGQRSIHIAKGFNFGSQTYRFSDGTTWTQADVLDRISAPLRLHGSAGGSTLRGSHGADLLLGGIDNDVLLGGNGRDTLSGSAGNDTLDAGVGGGTLSGDDGNDVYLFGRGDGSVTISDAAPDWVTTIDVLRFKPGVALADLVVNRLGSDLVLTIAGTNDVVTLVNHYVDSPRFSLHRVEFDGGASMEIAALEARAAPVGSAGADYLYGGNHNDVIHGYQGGDYLYGLEGNDQLFGDEGNDLAEGGNGDDLLDGGAGIHDQLLGGAGNDTLTGGEVMTGGTGSDRYVITQWDWNLVITEDAEAGNHTDVLVLPVNASAVSVGRSYNSATLGFDDLLLSYTPAGTVNRQEMTLQRYFTFQGNEHKVEEIRFADNVVWRLADILPLLDINRLSDANDGNIYGFQWDDELHGLGGDDRLSGMNGNDQLFGDDGRDYLSGDVGDDLLSGGSGFDSLYGGSGNDTLDGGADWDRLNGSIGNDTYLFGRTSGFDGIQDDGGVDRIVLGAGVTTADVSLLRNGSNLVLVFNQGNTQLEIVDQFGPSTTQVERIEFAADGSAWDAAAIQARTVTGTVNAMTGTVGNDIFTVDNASDTITEASGQGTDTIETSVSYVLGANIENLTLTGVLHLNAEGNVLDNVLSGNAGHNTFNGPLGNRWSPYAPGRVGQQGADTMIGGAGDDTYYVDGQLQYGHEANDVVVEGANGGNDTVIVTNYDYTLTEHVENLVSYRVNWTSGRQSVHRRLIGNAQDNIIDARQGDAPAHLDGGTGNDTMYGSARGDIYVVDSLGDQVIETGPNYYWDEVRSSVAYTLGTSFEQLTLTGSNAIQGTGNAERNILDGTGNTAANVLRGLAGDDTYRLGAGDTAIEAAGEGNDTVVLAVDVAGTYSVATFGHIENLSVVGVVSNVNLLGTAGDNILTGNDGANLIEGGAGNDTLYDALYQNIWGHYTDIDTLLGGAGDDVLTSHYGADLLEGGLGNDTYSLSGVGAVARFNRGDGQDIVGANQYSRIQFGAGIAPADLHLAREGTTLVIALAGGTDTLHVIGFFVEGSSDLTNRLAEVMFEDDTALSGRFLGARVTGGGTNIGSELNDGLLGSAAAEAMNGLAGNDTLLGLGGNDTLIGEDGDDVLEGNAGDDSLSAGAGSDVLKGGNGADSLHAGIGEQDVLIGGLGADAYFFSADWGVDIVDDLHRTQASTEAASPLIEDGAFDEIVFDASVDKNTLVYQPADTDLYIYRTGSEDVLIVTSFMSDTEGTIEGIRFADGSTLSRAAILDLATTVHGTTGNDTLYGYGTGSKLYGYAGADQLNGEWGSDLLDGGTGNDTLRGGDGNDTYRIDSTSDFVTGETSSGGIDTIETTVTLASTASNVENLTLIGGNAISGTGNSLANVLTGNGAVNTLSGAAGHDTLDGGAGNDTIDGGSGNDVVLFGRGDGRDTMRELTADATVGKLNVLRFKAGVAVADVTVVRVGTTLEARINGTSDAVVVTDFFYNSDPNSSRNPLQRIEFANGTAWSLADIVQRATPANSAPVVAVALADRTALEGTALSFALPTGSFTDPDAGDVLTYSATLSNGSALPSWLSFNASTRTFSGTPPTLALGILSVRVTARDGGNLSVFDDFNLSVSAENKVLTGGTGADLLTGYSGNDSISGAAGNDTLVGAAGNDTLDGGTGIDSMTGGAGNDLYRVDSATDVIVEAASEGTDAVESLITHTLGSNVENLTLTGTAVINGTGNTSANSLTGNSVANRLDGGSGIDTMAGGAGDDVYVVDNTADVVTEAASAGTDRVESSVSYTLGANVENLTLTGTTAINATGNTSANALIGNSGANRLEGGTGIDTMTGGTGDDVYVVDNTADVVTEAASSGTDTVESNVSLTLATNVENLTLTGTTAINATGNTGANTLRGNAGANTLNGGTGTDTLIGGAGNDIYVVDATDVVTELASEGTDLVQSGVTYTLATNVENLTLTGTTVINGTGNTLDNVLTGNSANNTLTAGAGHDTLDGGTGNDTMVGGVGNDIYVVNVSTDVVTELANEGTDLVQSSVIYTLGNNVENLTLLGTTALNGTGNTLNNALTGNSAANVLTGGAGNDTLNGAAGADSLRGGTGDDVYWVDVTTDVLTENANEGTDSVNAGLTWTLATNFENLSLAGTGAFNGTGNTVANALTGNAGANTLTGLAGNDTLDGLTGNDILIGGVGADTYVFNRGHGQDTVQENDTTANVRDSVQFAAGITQANLSYQRVGNNLEALLSASTDKLVFTNWYLGNQYHVEDFRFGDGSVLTDTQVQGLVSAMASFGASATTGDAGASSTWRGTQPELAVSALG